MTETIVTVRPTDEDVREAREAFESLSAAFADMEGESGPSTEVRLKVSSSEGQRDVRLPTCVSTVLIAPLQSISEGDGVSVTPIRRMLTSQQAADYLDVSRPYLVESLLETGRIPFHRVGVRRRVRLADLEKYRAAEAAKNAERERRWKELFTPQIKRFSDGSR